jgi:hypothetical protein
MHRVLGRVVIWLAEILDRSLLVVPDLDEPEPAL